MTRRLFSQLLAALPFFKPKLAALPPASYSASAYWIGPDPASHSHSTSVVYEFTGSAWRVISYTTQVTP